MRSGDDLEAKTNISGKFIEEFKKRWRWASKGEYGAVSLAGEIGGLTAILLTGYFSDDIFGAFEHAYSWEDNNVAISSVFASDFVGDFILGDSVWALYTNSRLRRENGDYDFKKAVKEYFWLTVGDLPPTALAYGLVGFAAYNLLPEDLGKWEKIGALWLSTSLIYHATLYPIYSAVQSDVLPFIKDKIVEKAKSAFQKIRDVASNPISALFSYKKDSTGI